MLTIGSSDLKVIPYFFIWNDFAVNQLKSQHKGIKWHRHPHEPVYRYDNPRCKEAIDEINRRNMPVVLEEEFENSMSIFMETLKASIKNFLTNPIHLRSDKESLDLKTAKEIADQKAREFGSDPILLAWYQGKTGDFVPKAECGIGGKPGWITYAESREADITIDINDEEYIFIYKSYL